MPKHVHCELIKAWADGKEIDFYDVDSNKWLTCEKPAWNKNIRYRIKPELSPTHQVRFFIYHPYCAYYEHVCGNVRSEEDALLWEKDPRFIKWITDWIHYNV
jgi:hypothetical protein